MPLIDPRQLPTDQVGLISRTAALRSGFSDAGLAAACREGDLVRVSRGFFVHPRDDRTPEQLHRLSALAAVRTLEPGRVISHESAASLHGLAMLKPALDRVHYITGAASGGRRSEHRHAHVSALAAEETTCIDGVAVTSLERTAIDVACSTSMGFAGALAALDSALHLGADRSVLTAALHSTRRRGIGAARSALVKANGLSESVGESWSRAQIIEAGLPLPRLQHTFRNPRGRFIAQTDFDWDCLLAGEFDGMVKYGRDLRPGETPFDAMRREKDREDELRRNGVMVVRWIWRDLERRRVPGIVHDWLGRLEIA